MTAHEFLRGFGAAGFGEQAIFAPTHDWLDARFAQLLFIHFDDIARRAHAPGSHDDPDAPMPELKQIIHRLLRAAAIIAHRVIEIPLREIIVDDDHWIFRRGKVGEERMTVAVAQAQHAIHETPLEQLDVLAILDELLGRLLEHDLESKLTRAITDPADQL